ncbi:alpha/beta hydrolase [Agrococcus sp. KRD186]|jgi:hypothetical protein|uniref:alpha/beta hydrolase n=1 Tax=Agrococcus sp. KRD186 TaxID=2729730 RepID=UPI0019CFE200|nr:alpha/beta hydrolase [Agrococcus sp. KRD186]
MRLVFAHGSGHVGRQAFPEQAEAFPDARFPVLPGYGDDAPAVGDVAAAAHLLALEAAEADGLVGYSFGGVSAAIAACMEQPAALVLIEPALFQLSREQPASAALIARLEPIYLDAALTDERFGRSFLRALQGEDPGPLVTPDALSWSRRTRLHGAPWRHRVDPDCIAETRTLVLSGGWNDEYEEVAASLVELGAEHAVLAGHGHRVIDHPECSERIRAFIDAG